MQLSVPNDDRCTEDQVEYSIDYLMKEYGQQILWLSYSYVKDKNLAEDITQDVFIKCYQNMESFRGDSSLKTWLYRITSNRCKDVLKSWSYRSKKMTEYLFDQHISPNRNPEQEMLAKFEDRDLSLKVLSLPIKYREVIFLHYFEEYKIEDLSALLGIKPNTVKSRLHRGRNLLKEMYDKDGVQNGK
ncbi:sigma-70 family RNA polymerase sigma factor [Bacillus sp. 31A1R]|uniref:Sigma-70 family RNA polymerase sigma factor n=1 Tax=Robertmurraya mangrovi TaxID=3098077 RepID=A0ABU5IX59_9BACI|nr:sigma-70 family RNA polymerase sigma factor [Bacillus sp. 31A1R]MDZ5471749.1 sigma-70 family RNA polymerase sigma factor [Bacillus sp. 31A1R]